MKRSITLPSDLKLSGEMLAQDTWVFTPQGAIDSNTSEDFKNRLEEFFAKNNPTTHLLLDMSFVKYISSVGLGALIAFFKRTKNSGAMFGVYNPQLAVQRVLEISKLDFLLVKPQEPQSLGVFSEYVLTKEAERAAKQQKA